MVLSLDRGAIIPWATAEPRTNEHQGLGGEIDELVRRLQAGDQQAFSALYEQLSPRIYAYLYYHLHRYADEAEDLTTNVFLKVLEKVHTFEFRGVPFHAWVYRIARNHLIDHLRSRNARPIASIDDSLELREEAAERELESALTVQDLQSALTYLTEEQRQVIVLRFIQGLSTLETALVLDRSEDAIKKLQARGLLALKRVLSSGYSSTGANAPVGSRTRP